MTRQEIFEKMMMDSGFGESKLQLRSEAKQDVHRVARIPRLKKALKKKSRLLIITELALPFDPNTGEVSDKYNADTKYRTTASATTTALGLKVWSNTNQALKDTLMQRAGITEWDTSDPTTFTDADWKVFSKYRVPRIFSLSVIHVNIPAMISSEYGKDFELEVEYDPLTGEIIGEMPGALKVNKLFNDRVYEELQDYKNKIDSGECKDTEKVQQEVRTKIRNHCLVSGVHPSNYVTAIELPMTAKYDLSGEINYKDFTVDTAKEHLVMFNRSKKIKEAIGRFTSGEFEKFDKEFDYYVIDMSCPTEGDETTDYGKAQIGQSTTFDKPAASMKESLPDEWESVHDKITEYIDSDTEIEKRVRSSTYTPKYTEEVEKQIYMALPTVIDLDKDKFFTQKVLDDNREVISIAFAGVGDRLLDDIDNGISDKAEGELDTTESAEQGRQYSLESADFQDEGNFDMQLDEVPLAE